MKMKLMMINGSIDGRKRFQIGSVIDVHVRSRLSDLNKFYILCKANETMPFRPKKEVPDAMILTENSLLYG